MLKRILWALAFSLLAGQAWAVEPNCQFNSVAPIIPAQQFAVVQCDTNGNLKIIGAGPGGAIPAASSSTITASSSTLTSGTATAITATNNFIASNTTAGSVVVPSFAIANAGGGAIEVKMNLTTSATSGWGNATVYVNLYSAAPAYTNGDGGVWAPTVATSAWLDQYTCTFTQMVTNAQAICTPVNGNASILKLASGTAVYWDIVSQSTITKASGQTFTLTAFLLN